jgi:uncharacterized protein with NAD-binding domain and iron-sulfur cluster
MWAAGACSGTHPGGSGAVPEARTKRTKVAVLGGGVGAMTAAFELSAPELEGRYEVTVYQPGWRLGGKCASGRRGPEHRIEEHGLHVWFGFYANAFRMIQRCYEEWEPPAGSPIRSWEDAFKKCDDIVLFEHWRGKWSPWHLHLPPDDLLPGARSEPSVWDLLHRLLMWLLDEWKLVLDCHGDELPEAARPRGHRHLGWVQEFGERLLRGGRHLEFELLELAEMLARTRLADPGRDDGDLRHLVRLEGMLRLFKRRVLGEVLEQSLENAEVRRFAIFLDFWSTVVTGMLDDRVLERGFGPLNREDLRAWLRRHGAEDLTLKHAAFIQALYDLVFAYRDGDKRHPDLAAGKALQAMIRIVAEYRGAVLWKMQAGMGDTVFTPLYDVLRRRGVRFRFFHQVTKLGVSEDGQSVATIEVQPQARLKGSRYDPIVRARGLRCWPSEPKWHLLRDGEELCRRKINFENEVNPLQLKPKTLRAGKDFDQIVLGIPVGALPPLCEELAAANPRFGQMLETASTVMTEGIQLWLSRGAGDLGWEFETSITTSYVPQADTYSNMPQLLARERWPKQERPAEIAYLCGVIKHAGVDTQAAADARVRENAMEFLTHHAAALWPHARRGTAFDWRVLCDRSGAEGERRLDAQLLRANFQPTERYVMTRAGSVEHRLRADESGFANLVMAGDWTRNGIDGGSVEAAATSGMQAARAISGHPKRIQGERGWLVDD